MSSRPYLASALIAALVTVAHANVVTPPALEQPPSLPVEIELLKNYHDSGRYMADIRYVDTEAQKFIASHSAGKKLAIVLDIDETSLSNWPEMLADNFAYFPLAPCSMANGTPTPPCGALAWDALEKAPAIPPTLALFNFARARGITVFFITGRHESERCVTRQSLIDAGYEGWDPGNLLMEPDHVKFHSAADFKAPKRKWIEHGLGYTIVANVGDQWSDLAGGHAEGDFKLPNPFYYLR